MADGITYRKISPFALLLLFSLYFSTIPKPAIALKIKLVHRLSEHSPLKPGNLTDQEISRKLAELSQARSALWASTTAQHFTFVRPIVWAGPNIYYVQLAIGTPPRYNFLLLDTGSDLIWTQCLPCDPCMPQEDPIFDPANSNTFFTLPCDHSICTYNNYPCVNNKCTYAYNYLQPASTRGELCVDTFTFDDTNGGHEPIPGIVFGCGHAQEGFQFGDTVSGILGMGPGPQSFISQFNGPTRFSYCFPKYPWRGSVDSFLHLGDDATIDGNFQTTSILPHPGFTSNYSVNLLAISVGDKRVEFAPGSFGFGCVVDSGTSQTLIPTGAYVALNNTFIEHFSQFEGLQPFLGTAIYYHLCYKTPNRFNKFPSMTYHFDGADFYVPPDKVVDVYSEVGWDYFCLTVVPSGRVTVLGSIQQADNRFLYDLINLKLSFAPANCIGN